MYNNSLNTCLPHIALWLKIPDSLPVKLQSSALSNEHVSELPIDQVAVPVGGKAYLPCDTRNQDLGKSTVSSGFFMVMWFKEQKENNPGDQSYEQPSSISSTSGEPIFT
ncbi:hypothetical protein QTP88_011347 [Uroleucon formosanum]